MALDDAFAEAWRALGEHLARLDRWDEAQAAFERLLELAPDDYTAHRALAQVFASTGRGTEALAHAERAVSLAPDAERPAAAALLAQVQSMAGKDAS